MNPESSESKPDPSLSLWRICLDLYHLLPSSLRAKARRLILFQSFCAGFEVIGVFSILPFLALASDPAILERGGLLARLREAAGSPDPESFLWWVGIGTLLVIAVNSLLSVASVFLSLRFANQVHSTLVTHYTGLLLSRRYAFFLGRNSVDLGNTLLSETSNLHHYAIYPLVHVFARGTALIAVGAALLLFNWRATLAIALVLGLFFGGIYAVLKPRMERHGRTRLREVETRNRWFQAAVQGIKDVKGLSSEAVFLERISAHTSRSEQSSYLGQAYQLVPRHLVEGVVFGGVVLAVLFLLSGRDASLVELVPALSVYAVAGYRMLPGAQALYSGFASLRLAGPIIAALRKLGQDLEDSPAEGAPPAASLRMERSLALRRVSFRYDETRPWVLKDVDLEIAKNSYVGIMGPSGSGKSTLMDLAMGLIEPVSGSVEVDGKPLVGTDRRAWQLAVGYVPQTVFLMDATLAENIAFGVDLDKIDVARVEEAARLASLHDFVSAQLPEGYATRIGERGVLLSGGQRQRIGIARALYRRPEVLFLDEATSALDPETEAAIVESTRNLAGRMTIVAIAHREGTLRHCECIVRLDTPVQRES